MCQCDPGKMSSAACSLVPPPRPLRPPVLQRDTMEDGQHNQQLIPETPRQHFHDTPSEHFPATPPPPQFSSTSSGGGCSSVLESKSNDKLASKPPIAHRASSSHRGTYISGGKLRVKTTSGTDKHVRWQEKDIRISPVVHECNKENSHDKDFPQRPPRSRSKKETVKEFRWRMKQMIAQEQETTNETESNRINNSNQTETKNLHQKQQWIEAWVSDSASQPNVCQSVDLESPTKLRLCHSNSYSGEISSAAEKLETQTGLCTSRSMDDLDIAPGNNFNHDAEINSTRLPVDRCSDSTSHATSGQLNQHQRFLSPDALSRHKKKTIKGSVPRRQTTIVNMANMVEPEANLASRQKVGRQRSFSDLGFKSKDMLQTPRTMALLQNPAFRKHIAKTLDLGDESNETDVKETIEKRFQALKMGSAHTTHLRNSYSCDSSGVTKSHPPLKVSQSDTDIVSRMRGYAQTLNTATSSQNVQSSAVQSVHKQNESGASVKNESSNIRSDIARLQIPSYKQFKSQRRQASKLRSSSVEMLVPEPIVEEDAINVRVPPMSASFVQKSFGDAFEGGVSSLSTQPAISSNSNNTSEDCTTSNDFKLQDVPKRAWKKRSRRLFSSAENPLSSQSKQEVLAAPTSKSHSEVELQQSRNDTKPLRKSHSESDTSCHVNQSDKLPKAPPRKTKRHERLHGSKSTSCLLDKKTNLRKSQENELIIDCTILSEGSIEEQSVESEGYMKEQPVLSANSLDLPVFASDNIKKEYHTEGGSSGKEECVLPEYGAKKQHAISQGGVKEQPAIEAGYVSRSRSDVSERLAEEKRTRGAKDKKNKPYKSDPFQTGHRNRCSTPLQPDILEESREEVVAFLQQETSVSEANSTSSLSSVFMTDASPIKHGTRRPRSQPLHSKQSCGGEVERVDSGVGRETSAGHGPQATGSQVPVCEDCDTSLAGEADGVFVCGRCEKRRAERKDIIQEIVNSEANYGQDLRIIQEEFYVPMKSGHLLNGDQIQTIFLNLEELISINESFSEQLQDALDIANEHGDEDLLTVHIGKLFIEATNMLLAFESYCINQSGAPPLIDQLEREKHLLRIFLKESQNENSVLRRMDLKSFLVIPVQRIMRYPLLLDRLYKLTSPQHPDCERLLKAKRKIEDILEHINFKTKGTTSVRLKKKDAAMLMKNAASFENIELNRVGIETLAWNRNESDVVFSGRVLYAPTTDVTTTRKGGRSSNKFLSLYAVLVTLGKGPTFLSSEEEAKMRLDKVKQCALVLVKEKAGRYTPFKDPIFLDKSQASMDLDVMDMFEIIELGKDNFYLKAESETETKLWYQHIKFQTNKLGTWRKRRNALPNIMIPNMK